MDTTKKAIPELRSLFISGRLWFDKSGGNTYHAVSISANGSWLVDIGMTYGYGDQYLQTALEWLKKFGLVSEEVKSIYDLRDTLDLYTTYKDTLKKNLFEDSIKNKKVHDYAGILIKIEALKAGEF
jgi:hypothetical protein